MKPERGFIAERVLAQHCPELLRVAPPPGELLPLLGQAGARLARALGPALAPMLGHEIPEITTELPRECGFGELSGEIAPLAANLLLAAGGKSAPLLVSIEAGAVLRLVDRAFGGKGEAPSPLPEAFPLSAELMIARLEALAVAAIAKAFALAWPGAVRPLGRDGSLAALAPFAGISRLAVQHFTITGASGGPWILTLALPLETLPALVGPVASPAPPTGQRAAANPGDEPYGALALELRAVLVDMAMPVSAIAALVPGQLLPVTVARSVPLRIGEATIAHGAIGALDERIAVQITHAF